MKRFYYFLIILFLTFDILTISCQKDPETIEKTQPTVSISADESFSADNTAKLTINLSAASEKDIVVRLAKADVESGTISAPAIFEKNVTISAGKTAVKSM